MIKIFDAKLVEEEYENGEYASFLITEMPHPGSNTYIVYDIISGNMVEHTPGSYDFPSYDSTYGSVRYLIDQQRMNLFLASLDI